MKSKSRVTSVFSVLGAMFAALLISPALLEAQGVSRVAEKSFPPLPRDSVAFVRVNQVGYLPAAPKVAVLCALEPQQAVHFVVEHANGRIAQARRPAKQSGAMAGCVQTWELDFTTLRTRGTYRVRAGAFVSPPVRIAPDVYAGLADTLLGYMRQQRSGFNPFLGDSAHRLDGRIVDHPTRAGEFIAVSGGWADAADYLQYVTTSATATYHLLASWRDRPAAFGDKVDARGLPTRNGVPDALDEGRHGLAWLLRMFPDDSTLFNQLGDDRDHVFPDLITTDTSDYGWGRGRERPVYPCTGKPQGIIQAKNRSTGYASTAGKVSAAMALGASIYRQRGEAAFADTLARKAKAAYALGVKYPGVCQTAPGRAPYFYEEDSWVDDMALAASAMFALTGDSTYARDAMQYVTMEPIVPWMGADTANHYQWYPWYNAAHGELAPRVPAAQKAKLIRWYREGLERVVARADNRFAIGIPFIWCSNDLLVAFALQARRYRELSGDTRFHRHEQAAIDWLFGANPWGTSMVLGIPRDGVWPRDPHTNLPPQLHHGLTGGLLDGPVYRTIYGNLRSISLLAPDEYARFNTGRIVYHDDYGDYSTNEHIMDGTAALTWLLAGLHPSPARSAR